MYITVMLNKAGTETLYHYHDNDVLVLEFETKSLGLFILDNVLKNRGRK